MRGRPYAMVSRDNDVHWLQAVIKNAVRWGNRALSCNISLQLGYVAKLGERQTGLDNRPRESYY